jgi:TetR/AcrR family transcriptional repressor of mexCD-oprJ operon
MTTPTVRVDEHGGMPEQAHSPARERRADARRNIAAILDAALTCIVGDPEASIGEIAKAAGVGRVTLYGHFSSRAELVDAVFARNLEQADHVLDVTDLDGDPRQALDRLIASSWQIVSRFRALLAAAQRELPAERIRVHHDRPMRRVHSLIERGQREGAFRTDLPTAWLVATFYSTVHSAADELAADRLAGDDVPQVITATLQAAFTTPGSAVPASGQI